MSSTDAENNRYFQQMLKSFLFKIPQCRIIIFCPTN